MVREHCRTKCKVEVEEDGDEEMRGSTVRLGLGMLAVYGIPPSSDVSVSSLLPYNGPTSRLTTTTVTTATEFGPHLHDDDDAFHPPHPFPSLVSPSRLFSSPLMRGLRIPPVVVRLIHCLAHPPTHRPLPVIPSRRYFVSPAVSHEPANPLQEIARQVAAAQRKESTAAQPLPSPAASASSDGPLASPSASPSKTPHPPFTNRYHSVTWRFLSHARSHSIQRALQSLEDEGRLLFQQRQKEPIGLPRVGEAAQRVVEEAKRQMGKAPPSHSAAVSPHDSTAIGSDLDWLSCHPPRLYLQLMRSFASYGDVEGCYVLLNRLYQLAMHTNGLIAFPLQDRRRKPQPVTSRLSQLQQLQDDTRDRAQAEERKQEKAQRSPFTPTGDFVAAIMSAYAVSSKPYPVVHHQQLFTHLTSLHLAPTTEFYHSLLTYHAHHHTVHTYITSMSLLSRSRSPPSSLEFIRAIRYFGLICGDQDSALVLFLHLSSIVLPNASAFNALIAVFAEKGDWMMAYRLMTDMEAQRQIPSAWTYAGLIRALLLDGREKVAMELHRWAKRWKRKEYEKTKDRWRDNCYVVWLEYWMQKDDIDQVMATWEEMKVDQVPPERTTYPLVIRALVSAGRAREACVLVHEMGQRKGFQWDTVAYYAALTATAAVGDIKAALRLYADMAKCLESNHLPIPSHVYTLLISAFPSSLPAPVESILPTTPTFTPLSLSLDLLSLLRDQQRRGVLPTPSFFRTLLSLLRAYGAHGGVKQLKDQRTREEGQGQVSWSAEAIDKAEEAILRELKEGKQNSTPLTAHIDIPSAPPLAKTAVLHV